MTARILKFQTRAQRDLAQEVSLAVLESIITEATGDSEIAKEIIASSTREELEALAAGIQATSVKESEDEG
jgi:hypothetical protein